MTTLFTGLLVIATLVSLACWIMTVIRMFKNEGALLGILSICGLIGFIMGWVKVKEHDSMVLMSIWSAAIVASIPLNLMVTAAGGGFGR